MAGKFSLKLFCQINLHDSFFDSLKNDYPGSATSTAFTTWFTKKEKDNATALIFEDENGIGAFVYIKEETEPICLQNNSLPVIPRLKIGTIKIAETHRGQRIGEGAIGLALWEWQRSYKEEIYVTVFPKHIILINQLEKFGFILTGYNPNGECVYLKNRNTLSYDNAYKSFPFVDPNINEAGYILFEDFYHDTMFPYSELKNTSQKSIELSVANGLSKIYVSEAPQVQYKVGQPVLIYRKYNGPGIKKYKSCLTSFCMITDIIIVKTQGRSQITFDKLIERIGNKSVFDEKELLNKYNYAKNLIIIEMLYYAYFGAGHNVNYDWLNQNNLWSKDGGYPTNTKLSATEFKMILKEGNLNVQNIIIN